MPLPAATTRTPRSPATPPLLRRLLHRLRSITLHPTSLTRPRPSAAAAAAATPLAAPVPARVPARGAPRPGAAGGRGAAILWLRTNLRLHDNPALAEAVKGGGSLLPAFIFDPRDFGGPAPRAGPYRAKFVLAALADLRASLRARGSDLVVEVGRPEAVLPRLAVATGARVVVCASAPAYADAAVEASVDAALARATDGRATLRRVWDGTVAAPDDVGGVASTPTTFSAFCDAVAGARARAPEPAPTSLPPLPVKGRPPVGDLPTVADLVPDAAAVAAADGDGAAAGGALAGGETAGLAALRAAVTQTTPSGSVVAALAPWLAAGCVSARRVADDGGDAASVAAELRWRDFFRFTTARLSGVRLGERVPGHAPATRVAGAGAGGGGVAVAVA